MNKARSSPSERSHSSRVVVDSSSVVSESIANTNRFVQPNAMIQRQQQVASVLEDFENILWGRSIVPLDQYDDERPFVPDHREILMMSQEDIFHDDEEEGEQNLPLKADDKSQLGANQRIFPSSLSRVTNDSWDAFFEKVAPTSPTAKGDKKPAAVEKQGDLLKAKQERSCGNTTAEDNRVDLHPYGLLRNNFWPPNSSIHSQQGDVHSHGQASMARPFESLAQGGLLPTTSSQNHPIPSSTTAMAAGFQLQQQQERQPPVADPVVSVAKVQRKKSGGAGKPLPVDFQPQPYSVIVGKGRESKNVIGNNRLRVLASIYLPKYASADDDRDVKSEIVSTLIATIQNACPVGAFIKLGKDGRWYECPSGVAREKVGYTLRELLGDKYKSSSKAKAAMRSLEKSRKTKEQKQQKQRDNSR